MRVVRIPAGESDKLVVWERVTDVRFAGHERRRYVVIEHDCGGINNLEPHQARDLFFETADTRGCPPACFFRWECDGAPKDCMTCRLAEVLVGMDCEVRPPPIPPRRGRVFDARNVAIALLLLLVLLLVAALDAAPRPQEPRRDVLRQKRMK